MGEEYTCQRRAPEGLNRGQAGWPRALGPAGLGDFWLLSTSIFSGGFLVQLFASVQYILHALHHPNPVNDSFFAFDVHLQYYFFTLCHSPCSMLNHLSHGAIFAENHMSFHAWLLPPLNYLHVVVGREHNSFPWTHFDQWMLIKHINPFQIMLRCLILL